MSFSDWPAEIQLDPSAPVASPQRTFLVSLPVSLLWMVPLALFVIGFSVGRMARPPVGAEKPVVMMADTEPESSVSPPTDPVASFPQSQETQPGTPTAPVENSQPTAQPNGAILLRLKAGDALIDLLGRHNAPAAEVIAMSHAAKRSKKFRFERVKAGRPIRLSFDTDGRLEKYEYLADSQHIHTLSRSDNGWKAEVLQPTFTDRFRSASGTIRNTLSESASELGLAPNVVVSLAAVFQWDIDFNMSIRPGDRFSVIYKERVYDDPMLEAKPVFEGIVGAKFVNDGETYYGVQFGDDHRAYYDLKGGSLRKQFLKSPLPFGRVTSRFSRQRLHPVLGTKRPHYGIDIGAPTGTPIFATASGRVSYAGWNGGYGRMVRIKHPNGFMTEYGHMSKIGRGMRKGVKVSQGEVIGYVGSTGVSTGPHVHYGVKEGKNWLNPQRMKSPPSSPVASSGKAAFSQRRDRVKALLDDLTPSQDIALVHPSRIRLP